ncbi:SDR family NAD(P)-dependent oxidoreductase [Pseudodonghicola flavimaris]|uniref:Glucose 1-dehydrogenase n=1 Tax=Pseudodonghicola flavimaris TaxID=3050036 RepID=A0ABT7F573_9RHOB|nr:glucose 1-dehydrogenase [Pseudodonghicola flavimaris]MDK3019759.1 glucose 1-dehydrogenase [Pseudodonghicola flavimaris]
MTSDLFDLTGRVALVTGGASGIGLGIARALSGAGASVVIGDLSGEAATRVAAELTADSGNPTLGLEADVTVAEEAEALVARCVSTFGGLDILVNNAGIGIHVRPEEMTMEQWDKNVSVNLRAVFHLSKIAYAHLCAGGGKIINIGSMYSIFGAGEVPAYAASKGGVVQLTKSLAIAWAEQNIQVNAILPGWINTGLGAQGRREMEGLNERVLARTPANRWGEPEDLAGTAIFLASGASSYVTGVSIPVDGGYSVT